jgi:oligosaccharide repeat unit polymerase
VKPKSVFNPKFFALIVITYYAIGLWNPFDLYVHRSLTITSAKVILTLGITVAGVVSFFIGSWLTRERQSSSVIWSQGVVTWDEDLREFDSIDDREYRNNTLYRSVRLFFLLGATYCGFFLVAHGVPILQPFREEARREFFQSINPYVGNQWYLLDMSVPVCFYLLLQNYEKRASLIAMIVISLGILAAEGSRVMIADSIVISAIVYSFHRRIRYTSLIIWGSIFLILVVGLMWVYRVSNIDKPENLEWMYAYYSALGLKYNPVLYIIYQALIAVTLFCRTSTEVFIGLINQPGMLHGEITFMSLISAILPGHHQDLGLYHVSSLLGYDRSVQGGTTVSLVGGLYLDFGIAGVLIGMLLLGVIFKYFFLRSENTNDINFIFIYSTIFSYYLSMIYGGQFLDTSLLYKILILIAIVNFTKKKGVYARLTVFFFMAMGLIKYFL